MLAYMNSTPDLASFDFIIVNTSAGKDSQAMLDYLVELADAAGCVTAWWPSTPTSAASSGPAPPSWPRSRLPPTACASSR